MRLREILRDCSVAITCLVAGFGVAVGLSSALAQVGGAGTHFGTGRAGRYPELNFHGGITSLTNSYHDVETIRSRSSGTTAAHFAATTLYKADNAAGDSEEIGRAGFAWKDPTDGSEDSAFRIWTRQAGAALQAASDPMFSFYEEGNIARMRTPAEALRLEIINNVPMVEVTTSGVSLFTQAGATCAKSDNNTNFAAGAGAVATTATNGFLHIVEVNGTPTGTPSDIAGYTPCVYDTSGDHLCCDADHDGSWRCF